MTSTHQNANHAQPTSTAIPDREAWLTEAAGLILSDIVLPAAYMTDEPPFRVSVGFPTGRQSKAIAACYKRQVSDDGTNELFVSPECADSMQVLAALVHELIHACDDCESGHRNFFARTARRAGLTGPLTATEAGPQLATTLAQFVLLLGHIPHAAMHLNKRTNKQTTRMLKVSCTDAETCGFSFRTTQKHIDSLPNQPICPACEESYLTADA